MDTKKIIIGVVMVLIIGFIGYFTLFNDNLGEPTYGSKEQYEMLNNYEGNNNDILEINDLNGEIKSYPAVVEFMYSSTDGWLPADQYFTFKNKKNIPINNVKIAGRFNGELITKKLYELVNIEKQIMNGSWMDGNGINHTTYYTYEVKEWIKRNANHTEINGKHIYYIVNNDFEAGETKTFKITYLPSTEDLSGKWDVIAFIGNPNNPDYSIILDPYFNFGSGSNWEGIFTNVRDDGQNLTLDFVGGGIPPFETIGNLNSSGLGNGNIIDWNITIKMPYNYSTSNINDTGTRYLLHMNESGSDSLIDQGTGISWTANSQATHSDSDCVIDNCAFFPDGANDGFDRDTRDDNGIEAVDISFEFWASSSSCAGSGGQCHIYEYSTATNPRFRIFGDSTIFRVQLTNSGGTSLINVQDTNIFNILMDGEQHHQYLQFGSGTFDWYVDGNLVANTSSTATIQPQTATNHRIGEDRGGTAGWIGTIDEFQVRTGANAYLTAKEIKDNFLRNNGKVIIQTAYGNVNNTWLEYKNFTSTGTFNITSSSKYVKFWVFLESLNSTITPYVQFINISSGEIIPPTTDNFLFNLKLETSTGLNKTTEDLKLSFTPINNNTVSPLFSNISFIVDWDNSSTDTDYLGYGLVFGMHMSDNLDYVGGLVGTENGGIIAGGVEGFLGKGTEFNGSQGIELPNDMFSNNEAISITSWSFDKFSAGNDNIIRNRDSFLVQTNRCFIKTTISTYQVGIVASLDEWVHISCVFDFASNSLTAYKNGVFVNNITTEGTYDLQSDWDIGKRFTNTEFFNGTIDEVNIWNRALTPTQVLNLYNSQVSWRNENVQLTNNTFYTFDFNSANTTRGDIWRSEIYLSDSDGISNFTTIDLKILNTIPTIPNINFPVNNTLTINYSITLGCSGSTDPDGNEINYEFLADLNTNPPTTIRQNSTNTTFSYVLGGDGDYWWRCRVNDNITVSEYNNTRLITVDRRLILTNITTFNHSVLVGTTQIFRLNITKNNQTVSDVDSEFIYNDIIYSVVKLQESNDRFSFTSSFIIPSIPSDPTLNLLNWNLTITQLNNTLVYNTSFSGGQSVKKLFLDNCTTFGTVIFNFTLRDEETQIMLGNGTIETAFNIYTSDRTSLIANLSAKYVNINPLKICMNENLTNANEYSLDTIVKYETDVHAIEYYNIVDFTLDSNTLTQNINLYDLNISDSTEFQLTFTSSDFLPVEDALVYVDRQYIAENIFKTVELPKTDTNGQTILHLVRNDVIYNIRILKGGIVLGNFENLVAFCDDFSIGNCKIELNAFESVDAIFDYNEYMGITFEAPIYDESTRKVSFTYLSYGGTAKTVQMDVTRNDIFGNRSVCSDTLLSTGGTLTCSIPSYIEDSSLRIDIFVEGDLIIIDTVRIDTENYGAAGYLIFFLMAISIILLFSGSKTGVLFGIIISFVGAVMLGLISSNIIGSASSGIWLIVVVLIGIYKLNKGVEQ